MNTSNETKTERGGFFRLLFGPSKRELTDKLFDELLKNQALKSELKQARADQSEDCRISQNNLRTLEKQWDDLVSKHKEEISALDSLLSTLRAKRNVSWPKPAVRMPEKLVLAEFNVPIDQGYPAAVLQELDDKIQELLDLVTQPPHGAFTQKDGTTVPAFTADDRLHLAGGVEHLRLFQKQLLDLSAKANTTDADLDKDEIGKE